MRLRIIIVIGVCMALLGPSVQADPLSDVARERRRYRMSSPPYSWYPTYDIEFTSQELHIYTSIYLNPVSGVTQQQIDELEPIWENGIEVGWNDRYRILHDDQYYYDIIYDVIFVDTFNPSVDHYQVSVRPGPARSNMSLLDTEDTPQVAAHEYGHMIGNYDEYNGGGIDPSNPIIDPTSLMGSTSPTAVPYSRHYEPVLDWLEAKYPFDVLTLVPVPQLLPVSIDIRPRSEKNILNLTSNGVLPVAILGDDNFDVTEINLLSLDLAGVAPITKGNSGKIGFFTDVNDDDLMDLMLYFRIGDLLDIGPETTELFLKGSLALNDEPLFGGSDSIRLVGPGDVNADGVTDGLDLSIIIGNWGISNARYDQGDLSGDGVVEGSDYGEVLSHWGQDNISQVVLVPEPATLGLILLGGLAILKRPGPK